MDEHNSTQLTGESIPAQAEQQQPAGSTLPAHETGSVPAAADQAGSRDALAAESHAAAPAVQDYSLAAPDGWTAEEAKNFEAGCKGLGLNREQAEKALAHMAGEKARAAQNWMQQRQAWRQELEDDALYGGRKFADTVIHAQKALAQFDDSGEVRRLLEQSGYGDNPAVIRLFARIGREIGEDSLIGRGSGDALRPLEERFYPD